MKNRKNTSIMTIVDAILIVILAFIVCLRIETSMQSKNPVRETSEPFQIPQTEEDNDEAIIENRLIDDFVIIINSPEPTQPADLHEYEYVEPAGPYDVEETSEEKYYYYIMSEDDINELATLVYLEAGAESFDCQCGVASVVLNRMTTRDMTLQEVIYEEGQFSPAYLIPYTEPTETSLKAVYHVLENGPTLPEYVTYFRADYFFNFATPYVSIDQTYFSYDPYVAAKVGY